MKLRAPSVPIITVDPYTSIWSPADKATDCDTVHWTGKPMPIRGYVTVDGQRFLFLGDDGVTAKAAQADLQITAMSTEYTFALPGVTLVATFTAPMFLDDYDLLSRPANYLKLSAAASDGEDHRISVKISVGEEICQDKRRQADLVIAQEMLEDISLISMASEQQPILLRFGDDVRIDWGTFYLSCAGGVASSGRIFDRNAMTMYVSMEKDISREDALLVFAYDDIKSIDYFHDRLTSWWNRDGADIREIIRIAHRDYEELKKKADAFDSQLIADATACGGWQYAELLSLAYRQVLAAHKLVVDTDGALLYISKECFSNGCAATADVSYPSTPLFLLYNPRLIHAMMRPIFKYAKMPDWPHAFAPHDVGTYPILWGQTYGGTLEDVQMPIEECGNMLIMMAASCLACEDFSYAREELLLLKQWAEYLVKHGADPENQLCSDDFAGHSPHNCNLAVKAIMGVKAMGIICDRLGIESYYHDAARQMAQEWEQKAVKADGSYKLAFDNEAAFSLKYNMVWDKLFDTHVFSEKVARNDFACYLTKRMPYGIPLDSRATYSKSDWITWAATLAEKQEDFETVIASLWNAYHCSTSRVPMTDWYDTVTAEQIVALPVAFQHRSVQGGLYIRLLENKQVLRDGGNAQ